MLTHRARAILRDVAAGHVQMTCSCEPDLLISGRCCCDQFTAHQLATEHLIRPAVIAPFGEFVRAELTADGLKALSEVAV